MKILSRLIFLFCLLLSGCMSNVERKYVFKKNIMYTTFDIVIYSKCSKNHLETKINNIWRHLEELEYDLSPAGDGFLGNLNKNGFVNFENNPIIFNIVSNFIVISQKINTQSDGAFDLTVYPLIRLWGFYLQDKKHKVPSDEEIDQTLKQVGMNHIIFTNNGMLLQNNVKIDLGAIAKGYAVDIAIDMLKEITNISAGFVNAGGNIKVYGSKPDGTSWKVGIRNPNGSAVQEIVSLYDGEAIATSGDYEQFFIADDGTYYHHIFNPKTGRPVSHNLASISVILKGSAELTDILATTFLALGTEETKKRLSYFDPDNIYSIFYIERRDKEVYSFYNENWKSRQVSEN